MAKAYQRTAIWHVTDTTDDDARMKIQNAYTWALGKLGIRDFDYGFRGATTTLEIGTIVSELLTSQPRPEKMVISVNCAPPDKGGHDGKTTNHRREFFCAELDDGTVISGTLNGYELSYVKNRIKSLYRLTSTNSTNSQFRSKEILPSASLRFSQPSERRKMLRSEELVAADIDKEVPTPADETHVFRVDNFGNVGLYLSAADRKKLSAADGKPVKVSFAMASLEVGGTKANTFYEAFTATVRNVFFSGGNDTLQLVLNSSSLLSNGDNMPMVIDLRAHPAATKPRFELPPVGARVKLEID
jgi:hypothetical protein